METIRIEETTSIKNGIKETSKKIKNVSGSKQDIEVVVKNNFFGEGIQAAKKMCSIFKQIGLPSVSLKRNNDNNNAEFQVTRECDGSWIKFYESEFLNKEFLQKIKKWHCEKDIEEIKITEFEV